MKLSPSRPAPALVMINPHLPGLKAVRQDGRTQATVLWKVVVGEKEDQYQSAIRIAPGGRMSSPTSTATAGTRSWRRSRTSTATARKHLVVFDASTGRRMAEAGDERHRLRR